MRGQAHIAFADPTGAGLALRAMQGFTMFGKQIKVSYAKEKSHAIASLDGSFRMPQVQPVKESILPLAPFEAEAGDKRPREEY
jgi:U2 small nuclear ribonucleoprotein B''